MPITGERYPNISSDPKVQGGAVTVRGTRQPICTIAFYWRQGWDRSRLLDSYPQLTPELLAEVLRFYEEHQHESDGRQACRSGMPAPGRRVATQRARNAEEPPSWGGS